VIHLMKTQTSFMDNGNYARITLGNNAILVPGRLIRHLAVQVNNLQLCATANRTLA
jgi:hypothetical protein